MGHTHKKIRTAITAACLLTAMTLMTACGSKSDKTDAIMKAGVLKVAVCTDGNSMITGDGSVYTGDEADLIARIAAALNVKAEYTQVTGADAYTDCQNKLKDGSADIAIGEIPSTVALDEKITETVSYGNDNIYLVTQRGDYSSNIVAFQNRKLGYSQLLSYMSGQFSDETYSVTGQPYTDNSKVKADILSGEIGGFACRLDEAMDIVGEDGTLQLQEMGDLTEDYVILIPAGNDKLLSGINTIIGQEATDEKNASGAGEQTKTTAVTAQ